MFSTRRRARLTAVVLLVLGGAVQAGPPGADPLPPGAVARLGWRTEWGKHSNGVSPLAAFSPDGKLFAAADGPGFALFDVRTGKLLRRVRACPTFLHTLGFGPDNTVLCLAHGSVHVWDGAAGKELRSFRVPETWDSAAFSPGGRLLASASRVWDVAAGKELYRLDGHPLTARPSVSFSQDGRLLLVSWTDYQRGPPERMTAQLRVHEAATGKLLRSHSQPGQALEYAVLSPDGKTVAGEGYQDINTSAASYYLRLLDLQTGKELRRFNEGEPPRIKPSFSPDGKYVTVVHIDKAPHVWEVATGKPALRLDMTKETGGDTLVFSPDGTVLAAATQHGHVHLRDVKSGAVRSLTQGHLSWVAAVAFGPDGKTLVSAAWDELLCWDLKGAAVTKAFQLASPTPRRLTVAPDGRHLLVSDGHVYDLRLGKAAAAFPGGGVWCFSADGRTLVWGKAPVPGFRCLVPVLGAYTRALSPDGSILVGMLLETRPTVHMGERLRLDYVGLRLSDTASGEELAVVKNHPAGGVGVSPVFSPDGKMMAGLVGNSPGALVLWETWTGQERLRLPSDGKREALAFSPDGRLLAFARLEGPIHLLDLALGKEAHKPLSASATTCLAFSPDGKLLASGNEDTTVLLWDTTRFAAARPAAPLPADDFDRLWQDLASPEGGRAYAAMRRLQASPAPAVALLRERIILPGLERDAARLIVDLNSARFKARQEAAAALEVLADRARPFLQEALKDAKLSLEQRRRIEKLLSGLGRPFSSEGGMRLLRSLEVLERIGSPEAVAVLRQVGSGPRDAALTREARQALRRLRAEE